MYSFHRLNQQHNETTRKRLRIIEEKKLLNEIDDTRRKLERERLRNHKMHVEKEVRIKKWWWNIIGIFYVKCGGCLGNCSKVCWHPFFSWNNSRCQANVTQLKRHQRWSVSCKCACAAVTAHAHLQFTLHRWWRLSCATSAIREQFLSFLPRDRRN